MTLTHIANLLDPLQSAIALQSWEDAEDIAREISRLARLQRLSELQKIQEALAISGSHQTNKSPARPHSAPNSPICTQDETPLAAPDPLAVISLETRFDEKGHPEPWRNQLAIELNTLLHYARSSIWMRFKGVAISVVARVAQFEEIQVKQNED